ncbi:MAG: acyl carrier protein [Bacillota bacterium]|nr:acyl carrier protein [Bacillota bacterium]
MILEKVKEIISEQLNISVEEINEDTAFEDLGADSLDLFQVVSEIEDQWNIRIEEVEKIKTVSDVVNFIENNIQ